MKKIFFKKLGALCAVLVLAGLSLGFNSCSSDDNNEVIALVTDQTSTTINLEQGESRAIAILQGNGGYTIENLDNESKEVVEVSAIKDNSFSITAIGIGTATVTLKDAANNQVIFTVNVTPFEGLATEVSGTYFGDLLIDVGEPSGTGSQDYIYVAALSENTVSATLKDFSFNDLPLGDIVLKDLALTGDAANATITENTQTITVSVVNVPMQIDVKTTGSFVAGQLTLKLTMDIAGSDIVVDFVGSVATEL